MNHIQNEEELAVSRYLEGFNCAQAVLSVFCSQLGLDHENALRVAAAFGGGLNWTGETCGVVVGAFMVIGLKYGNTTAEDERAEEFTNFYAGEFVDNFTARNGSIVCGRLLGCDVGTPEGRVTAIEKGLHETLCTKYVRDAAEIIKELM